MEYYLEIRIVSKKIHSCLINFKDIKYRCVIAVIVKISFIVIVLIKVKIMTYWNTQT